MTTHDEAIRHLSAADPRLSALIARTGPCLITARAAETDHFEGLVRAIASQQLSTKAAATIFSRVKALGLDETGRFHPATLLTRDDISLRGAGLSGQMFRLGRPDALPGALDDSTPALANEPGRRALRAEFPVELTRCPRRTRSNHHIKDRRDRAWQRPRRWGGRGRAGCAGALRP